MRRRDRLEAVGAFGRGDRASLYVFLPFCPSRSLLFDPPPSLHRLSSARATRRDGHREEGVAGTLAAVLAVDLSTFSLFFPSSPAALRPVAPPRSGKGARSHGRALFCPSRRKKAETHWDSTDLFLPPPLPPVPSHFHLALLTNSTRTGL